MNPAMTTWKQLIPELIVHDGVGAVEFYQKAFGFNEKSRTMTPNGKLMHAELERDGIRLFVCDEFPADQGGTLKSPRTLSGTGVRMTLEVDNADEVAGAAVASGAKLMMPVQDMFWGGRYGKIMDPFGHEWGINQTTKVMSEAEQASAARDFFAKRP
jgi:PhnB protein